MSRTATLLSRLASERREGTVVGALRSPRRLRRELLSALVVALALIPEAISFAVVAGVPPAVGLVSASIMAMTIAIVGGRPAMISAATGSVALVVAPVAREDGLNYLLATVITAGVFQILLALAGVAKLMRFVPRSVMVGFVNALAILIFEAQLPNLIGVTWAVYPLGVAGVVIIVVLPRLTRAVPAPLVAVVSITLLTVLVGIHVPTVGSRGALPEGLPVPSLPFVPLTWRTATIVVPYAFAVALVGLLESLMTARIVDEITDTTSGKRRESWGQGVANIVSGLLGGMGGCAMIGQTMINVRRGGARTRISTFAAGLFLFVLILALRHIVALIPMAALVAVMAMVSVGTFDWNSIRISTLRRMPIAETVVMLVTVGVTVATNDLAIGVVLGVIVATILFARQVAHLARTDRTVVREPDGQLIVRYHVAGQLFFASSHDLAACFDYEGDPAEVVIDVSAAHVWDASAVAALEAVTSKYERYGKQATIIGMNASSSAIHGRLAGTRSANV